MRTRILQRSLLGLVILLTAAVSAPALDDAGRKRLRNLADLTPEQLVAPAREVLKKLYPQEDWKAHGFPRYVHTSDAVETGYRIAAKRPELLAKFPCACFCDAMGHKNLADCFLVNGKPGFFDKHGSACNICVTEAMVALIGSDLGATEEEILAVFKAKYNLP